MRFVFASNNAHKLAEVREIMPAGVEVLSLHDIGFEQDIEETGATLAENSCIKAHAVYQWLKANSQCPKVDGVFADDTGLEIDALNGEPGVFTARWAERETGVHLPEMETYAVNRAKALRELASKQNRACQFKTVITWIQADGETAQVEGIVRGVMTQEERGVGGFGYDPIFMPEGYDKTFGELPAEIKNSISHRARALEAFIQLLEQKKRMNIRKHTIVFFVLCTLCAASVHAQKWTTHFAYNNVTQIALSPSEVYAISDGNLFSVNKNSEQITKYDRQSGLHSSGITCIHYDAVGKQLIIAYSNGKIDILSGSGVRYLSELYNKDMTQRKNIYNITIQGRMVYLSTHFGVQTLDLRENKLVDSYWLRPNGEETPIKDVEIKGDSIYAYLDGSLDKGKKDSVFSASLKDNVSDYTVWKREAGGTPDPNKGKIIVDDEVTWSAGGKQGILRQTTDNGTTSTLAYKPQGPLQNTPYTMNTYGKELYVVPGGRWGAQYNNPGVVMHYTGSEWKNIETATIKAKTGNPTLDFMNVAVDPRNTNHYFVTSYGTGLYEFDHDTLVRQYLPGEDNTIVAVVPSAPKTYTRLDRATYDNDNNLWFFTAGTSPQLICLDASGEWHSITINHDNVPLILHTPGGLIIDKRNPNHKWFSAVRYNTCLCLLDDNGTRFDETDDIVTHRDEWTDQYGQTFQPNNIVSMMQDSQSRLWFGTEKGVAYIPTNIDYTKADTIIMPEVMDERGENPFTDQEIPAICEDSRKRIWVGTKNMGVYVLTANADSIIYHYSIENSPLPSNGIMSLACDTEGLMYIGTAEGIACYEEKTTPTEGDNWLNEDEDLDMGKMQQWKLHYSYRSPSEIALSPNRVYANANGALFSLDLKTEELEYWTKSTGLNGSTIRHIAYDDNTKQLIIGYEDGRIDLLADDGTVRQMPDITLKASSIAVTINSISVGSQYVYLSMPFGVIALNARKAEVAATYYIGDQASAVDIVQVVEHGDSLYAFTSDIMYSASLKDDLVNYAYWHKYYLPIGGLQQAVLHNDQLYTLQNNSLYRWENKAWKLVRPETVKWVHALNKQLLVYVPEQGLFSLSETDQLSPITNRYVINDACYSNGIYWLVDTNYGLIRVNPNGDDYFHPSGPNSNFGYSMFTAHDQIYVAAGGRWAAEFARPARINVYDGLAWNSIDQEQILKEIHKSAYDIVSIAVDPNDSKHFFAASYGEGLYEIKDYKVIQHYSTYNSTLREAIPGIDVNFYTRVDGAMYDKDGNLWVLNATTVGKPLHILTPNGQWHALSLSNNNSNIFLTTPAGIWVDRRNEHRKWMFDQRYTQGVILLDDGGTPTRSSDDKCIKRDKFVDQNGNTIQPSIFCSWAQDYSNRIWIGTEKGIVIIPSSTDFFTSNACRRIIIPRNDGTGLGDYLLGEEQVNCLAVDGGNRMWIGTEHSGLYLIEDDTITVAHFTERNSLLPSNTIQSIAIMPTTGEVFVGTEKGIASYRSDASEPKENLKQAYAFPNPVRPDYGGMISIAGLMDNTTVNIIDASGNLVCKTRSHGGLAVWDGKLSDGRRATPGVYTALCNAEGATMIVKILVIH